MTKPAMIRSLAHATTAAALVAAMALVSASAWSQSGMPPPSPQDAVPPATQPRAPRTVPEQVLPSQRPARTVPNRASVIQPPAVDPGIQAAKHFVPDHMPVVHPPASPGDSKSIDPQ